MKTGICFILFLTVQIAQAASFNTWLTDEVVLSQKKIVEAMSFTDLEPGAVVASPSRSTPDYYYHWTRDAALTMDVVVELYQRSSDVTEKKNLEKHINNYILFSRSNQNASALTGLGEPKFYVDGRAYSLPWGRPQNDGPALRSLALMKWAELKLDAGDKSYVQSELYCNQMPADSVIKKDLEYVANHWREASFDLWEEVLGDHFFTRYVQRAALIKGAQLAQRLGDIGASDWYLKQALQIEASLKDFLLGSLKYIPATLNVVGDDRGKKSNLDSAVTLALLRAPEKLISWQSSVAIKTHEALINEFSSIYDINQNSAPGKAIGRYPEDVYDGDKFLAGNPWVLTTLAVAESYYEMSVLEKNKTQAQGFLRLGDQFFQRVQAHANSDGSLSEQIQRSTGHMTSAYDLTWNYSAVLTAHWARERAQNHLAQLIQ